MAYSSFTTNQLRREYGLNITRQKGLFADVPPVEITDRLRETLADQTDLALRSGSEKARSELIMTPILMEVYKRMQDRVNFFSGVIFDVDEARGLAGFCDFLFTLTPLAIDIQAPIIAIVEAKKEDIPGGIPQCLAELIAAQIYNAEEGRIIPTLYGIITSGEIWRFLRLEGTQAVIDDDLYYLDNVEKIVGIILSMLQGEQSGR